MSVSFVFGGSGAGKSTYLYDRMIEDSIKEQEKNYYIIVPDQFTMQTQKELVERHPSHGIMNIDVLSFGRLSHRIFEETGASGLNRVLDDTGKNLILRRVADYQKDNLKVLGGCLKKQGYIHEVKSAISEFMQYGIGVRELTDMIKETEGKSALSLKLADLEILYRSFLEFISEKYITTEETLHILAEKIPQSELLEDSVIVFDGFTGFTPVQMLVIGQLMHRAKEVIFTITIDGAEDPFAEKGEQDLFMLSRKTVAAICKLAQKEQVQRGEDIYLKDTPVMRLRNQVALSHLEKQLFRYPQLAFSGEPKGLSIAKLTDPCREAKYAAKWIRRLISEEGYKYRDIAVICGDLEGYGAYIRREFKKLKIPFFLDQNTGIMLNPFIEYMRSGLLLVEQNFSIDCMSHYLRTGMSDVDSRDMDMLDNYIRETGIHGKNKWCKAFTGLPMEQDQSLNEVREKIMHHLQPLLNMGETAGEKVRALYEFIVAADVEQKLYEYEMEFESQGDLVRAKQYHQVYPYIMDLLSQIDTLVGSEKISVKEFRQLLDAGFSEMQVGVIPQNVDHVVVGDMERTRLKQIRALFFLGVNDGNIPKNVGKGGIISDLDRETLQQLSWQLAPSPREQMYMQRMYLYMNMTKPSEKLFLSYCVSDAEGKSVRPSYLVEMIRKLYPDLTIEIPEEENSFGMPESMEDGYDYVAECLQDLASGQLASHKKEDFFQILKWYTQQEETRKETCDLIEQAFYKGRKAQITSLLAKQLYGEDVVGGITRFETFASCAYEHFLKYGLQLKERKEFAFEAVDMGNIFHAVLSEFGRTLPKKGYTWLDFPKKEGDLILQELVEKHSTSYGNAILYETARNRYGLQRMLRILSRTVGVLQMHLQMGDFMPGYYEVPFWREGDSKLPMKVIGRIDRIDICKENNDCYLKIIDYKSGKTKADPVAIYHGLQLQLATYMEEARKIVINQGIYDRVLPAGMFYYHIDDPMVEGQEGEENLQISSEIEKKLRMEGFMNASEEVIHKIEHTTEGSFRTLPLRVKKDGSFGDAKILLSQDDMITLSEYASHKITEFGERILSGEIQMNPYRYEKEKSCTFCPYKKICGFDCNLALYEYRNIEKGDSQEAISWMKRDLEKK